MLLLIAFREQSFDSFLNFSFDEHVSPSTCATISNNTNKAPNFTKSFIFKDSYYYNRKIIIIKFSAMR